VNIFKPGAPRSGVISTPSTPTSTKPATPAPPEEAPVSTTVTPRLETPSARETRMKQLGLSDKMVEHGGKSRPASKMFETLGARMEPVKLVNVPGRVMWVDFDLARELGFNVPKDNRMTPEFHQEILQALSYRVLKDGEDPAGKTVVQGGADRYQGTGMGGATGAGRAAFLPALNVNIKGAGRTPLASAPSGTDFTHSHGGAPAREGLLEAIWGLEADNLFANKGTRILAVIDSGDATQWADGSKEPRGLIVRAGNQNRPAHELASGDGWNTFQGGAFTPSLFVSQSKDSGLLVEKKNAPDYRETMLNAVDRQAQLTAEQFRNRILHAAVSTSNMEWDGGILDHGTTTSLSRTEPAKVLDFLTPFGTEHTARGEELERVYKAVVDQLRGGTAPGASTAGPIDFRAEMQSRYETHFAEQMLDATGFKPDLALALTKSQPDLTKNYAKVLGYLAALSQKPVVNIDKEAAPDVSTVDIFHLLQTLPQRYFNEPGLDLKSAIRSGLQVQGKEPPELNVLVDQLAQLYPKVMDAATQASGAFYDDVHAMKRSVTLRAEFENRPIDLLQRANISQRLNNAIDDFRHSSESHAVDSPAFSASIREVVDKTVAASVRSVEGLLKQGTSSKLSDGGLEVEKRTIDGIDYSVRGWDSGKRKLHVSFPIQGNDEQGYTLPSLRVEGEEHAPHLYRDQLEALTFRFTSDGWKNTQEVSAKVSKDEAGRPTVDFDIPVLGSDVGMLEGLFHCTGRGDFWWHDGSSNFRGYTFAVPDKQELKQLGESLKPAGSVVSWG
jgi:hypothetical protein